MESKDHKLVAYPIINFGCDPEFFFQRGGRVIGAEKVLPEAGISQDARYCYLGDAKYRQNKFVIDGVQAELNPGPNTCRANLGNEIALCFKMLRDNLAKQKDVKVSFDPVIRVDRKEFDSLCDKSKQFGCAPSKNIYDAYATIKVDASKYRRRAAGGHIHLGLDSCLDIKACPERLVTLLDVLVGNTCVIIDRDPGAVLRRKVYGRAGEYRLPKHGVEYRTLSNFWLRSYQLMSMVMGLARMAGSIMQATLAKQYVPLAPVPYTPEQCRIYGLPIGALQPVPSSPYPIEFVSFNAEKDLLDRVDLGSVAKAINKNDLDLALWNFEGVKAFIKDRVPSSRSRTTTAEAMALSVDRIPTFEYFCDRIIHKGLAYWFPKDPMDHWCNLPEGHGTGFEAFLTNVVEVEMNQKLRGATT